MRRWILWVAALYPARWRQRYGAEFAALVEDAPPRWTDLFDTLRGALEMQMANMTIWKTAALAGALGAAIAAGIAWRTPDRYISSAVLRMKGQGTADSEVGSLLQQTFSATNLSAIILRDGIYEGERTRLPMEDLVQQMRRNIRVKRVGGPAGGEAVLMVEFTNPSSTVAHRATGDLIAGLIQENLRRGIGSGPSGAATLELIDPPNLPARPYFPNRPVAVATGLGIGMLVGLAAGFLRRKRPARP